MADHDLLQMSFYQLKMSNLHKELRQSLCIGTSWITELIQAIIVGKQVEAEDVAVEESQYTSNNFNEFKMNQDHSRRGFAQTGATSRQAKLEQYGFACTKD